MIAGIDLGGTYTRLALARNDGCIVSAAQGHTRELATPAGLVHWAGEQISRLGLRESLDVVGIAAPGPLDPVRGVLVNPPNLVGWKDVPLASLISNELRCPAHLENDANLAGLGEFHQGAGRGSRNMVYVTWSTGVGAGLILDGKLFSGTHGAAGEIGHTIIDPAGPIDSCGQRGCVEAFCGGRALETQTGRSSEGLFQAAMDGDPESDRVARRAATYMGYAIVNLTNLFDPEVVVIGGGVTNSWTYVAPILLDVLLGSPFIHEDRRPQLRPAELGDMAGQVGAVEWARVNLP